MLLDMPDAEMPIESPASRPPVNDQVARHEFVESEFAPGCGRCDRCGGGPLADIHQERIDPMERIATALEEIAGALHRIEDRFREVTTDDTSAYSKFMQERGL